MAVSTEDNSRIFQQCVKTEEDHSKLSQQVLDLYFIKDNSEKITELIILIEGILADEKTSLTSKVLALMLLKEASLRPSKKIANCLSRQKNTLQQLYKMAVLAKQASSKSPKGRSRTFIAEKHELTCKKLAIECVCLWRSKFGNDMTKTAEVFKRLHRKLGKEIDLPKTASMTDSDIEKEPRRKGEKNKTKEEKGFLNKSMPDLSVQGFKCKESDEKVNEQEEEVKSNIETKGNIIEELGKLRFLFSDYIDEKSSKADSLLNTTGNLKLFSRKAIKVISELGDEIKNLSKISNIIRPHLKKRDEEEDLKFLDEIEQEHKRFLEISTFLELEFQSAKMPELMEKLRKYLGDQFSMATPGSQSLTVFVPKGNDLFMDGKAGAGALPIDTPSYPKENLNSGSKDDARKLTGTLGSATTPAFKPAYLMDSPPPTRKNFSDSKSNESESTTKKVSSFAKNKQSDSPKVTKISQEKEPLKEREPFKVKSSYNRGLSEQALQTLMKKNKSALNDLQNIQNGIILSLQQRQKSVPRNISVDGQSYTDSPQPRDSPQLRDSPSGRDKTTIKSSSKSLFQLHQMQHNGNGLSEKGQSSESTETNPNSGSTAQELPAFKKPFIPGMSVSDNQITSANQLKRGGGSNAKTREWLSTIDKFYSGDNSIHITKKDGLSPKSNNEGRDPPNFGHSIVESSIDMKLRDGMSPKSSALKDFIDFDQSLMDLPATLKDTTSPKSSAFKEINKIEDNLSGFTKEELITKPIKENVSERVNKSQSLSVFKGVLSKDYFSHEQGLSASCNQVNPRGGLSTKPVKFTEINNNQPETRRQGSIKGDTSSKYSGFQDYIDSHEGKSEGNGKPALKVTVSPRTVHMRTHSSLDQAGRNSPNSIKSDSPSTTTALHDSIGKEPKHSIFKREWSSPVISESTVEITRGDTQMKRYEFARQADKTVKRVSSPTSLDKFYLSSSKGQRAVFENEYLSIKSKYSLIEDQSEPERCLKVILVVKNKTDSELSSFKITFLVDPHLNFVKLPDKTDPSIGAGRYSEIEFSVSIGKPSFTHLKMKCGAKVINAGNTEDLTFKFAVPVTYNMFMCFHTQVTSQEFFSNWKMSSNAILKGEPMIVTNPRIKTPEDFTSTLGHLIIYPGLVDQTGKPKAYSLMGIFELEKRNVEYLLKINWIPENRTAAFQVACHENNIVEGRFILKTLQSLFCHVKTISLIK